ncbi:isochorismatase family protein [Roseibium sp. M-1]
MKRPLRLPRDKTAVLFVDLQEEQRQDERYVVAGWEIMLANVKRLQSAARQAGVEVIHSAYVVDTSSAGHSPHFPISADGRPIFSAKDDPLTELCPEVGPVNGEIVVIKSSASAFGNPELAGHLKKLGTEWLIVAGVWTEACIDATVKDAMARHLRVILVKDGCASGSVAMHQTAVLNIANRLYGGGVATTETACRMILGEEAVLWMAEISVPYRFSYENAQELYESL